MGHDSWILQQIYDRSNENEVRLSEFCFKEGVFAWTYSTWNIIPKPKKFSDEISLYSMSLKENAAWLFSGPAYLTPFELSFSTNNLVHGRTSNQLSPVKSNKICLIHINQRILNHFPWNSRESQDVKNSFQAHLISYEKRLCIVAMILLMNFWY